MNKYGEENNMQPALVIGLGGTGGHVIVDILDLLSKNPSLDDKASKSLQFMYVDIDTRIRGGNQIHDPYKESIDFIQMGYFLGGYSRSDYLKGWMEHACQHDENLKRWFDCDILKRMKYLSGAHIMVKSTAIFRQFGRLSLYRYLSDENNGGIHENIKSALLNLQRRASKPPLVIICASLIGGLGSSIALDIAYLVRHILMSLNMNADILGVFALGYLFDSALAHAPDEDLIRYLMNQVAAIKEIQHYAKSRYEFGPQGHVVSFDNHEPLNFYWLFSGDKSRWMEYSWPTDYYSLIATEILESALEGDWMTRDGFAYANYSKPLIAREIADWEDWEDIFMQQLNSSGCLCPYISREFC